MRVRLADVGDIPDLFAIGRGPARSRSMRRAAGGEGGGGGTDDDTGTDDADDKDDDADDKDDDADDKDDDDEDDDKDKKDKEKKPKTELDRAIARRDRALARARKAEAALAAATKPKDDGDDKPDPVAEANGRIVRTAAHGILRGLGVTDKDERAAVLDILRLDDIDVDDDGADEDAIEDRIDELRRILGAGSGTATKRVPKTKTRDRGGNDDTPADPDAARYRRILRRGR
jgi:hypothetical protein